MQELEDIALPNRQLPQVPEVDSGSQGVDHHDRECSDEDSICHEAERSCQPDEAQAQDRLLEDREDDQRRAEVPDELVHGIHRRRPMGSFTDVFVPEFGVRGDERLHQRDTGGVVPNVQLHSR